MASGVHSHYTPSEGCTRFLHTPAFKIGMVTGALIVMMANPVAALSVGAAAALCQAPRGSWSDTCKVTKSDPYDSSDPHLRGIRFCEFGIECRDLSGKNVRNRKVIPLTDVGCLGYMENCGGRLVPREDGTRRCTHRDVIEAEAQRFKRL